MYLTYRKTSDRSRAPNRRRAPHTGRGLTTLVLIEAGGFYPKFYGMYLWLLYASDSSLDNETSKFDGDICGYWKHVSMMVDSDAHKKDVHLSFV